MPHKVPSQGEIDALLRGEEMMEYKFEPFQKVLVRNYTDNEWICNLYSHYHACWKEPHVCTWSTWKYCIPFEGNEHLLGTTNSPEPKHEYKWGEIIEVFWTNQWRKALYNKKTPNNHFVYLWDACICVEDNEIRPLKED